MMQYMAERFLYLPLMGFLLALGALCLHLRRRGLAVRGGGIVDFGLGGLQPRAARHLA